MRKFLLALLLLPTLVWANSGYEAYILSALNPQAFWYFSEPSGTTLASVGSLGASYNLGIVNAPTLNQSGTNATRPGSALWVAASSTYAEVNANGSGTGPGDFTAARSWNCWVKNTGTATGVFLSAASSQAGGQADRNARLGIVDSSGNKVLWTIWQDIGTSAYIQVVGGTTMTAGVWYMVTGTWASSGTTLKAYLNATEDATTSTTAGSLANSTTWWAAGRSEGDASTYFGGNTQDCFAYTGGALSGAQVTAIYNQGISTGSTVGGWPFITQRPELPRFRDDDYMDKVVSRGYLTGHFTPNAMLPQYLALGYLPMTALPRGNAR